MQRYNPKEIEPKWQAKWEADKIYQATEDPAKPKRYVLEYFPYPSGAAMHVGHVRNYTIGDAIARFNRMNGYNVLHPMGWDAFGLPAENYAIKNKISPRKAIDENTARFKQQLMQMGFSYDWSREIDSTDPKYYRWTQWLFLMLFKRDLAYQQESLQWWCPHDKTVLANEQVEAGKCWRCGHEVEKKALKQWFFKITDYADRLLDDLEDLNWSEAIKSMQRNWIGRSKGAEIDFRVDDEANYVLLHGFTATTKDDFHPWLAAKLAAMGKKVQSPDLPNTDNPTVTEQVAYVQNHCTFDGESILIGHSLGSAVALKVVEGLSKPIKRLVLVAGFAQPGFKDHERPFEASFDWRFDFEKIKNNVSEIVILRAQNDSAVPAERADYLAEKTGGKIVDFIAQADHVCGKEEPVVLANAVSNLRVFTTRPDTLFGATFMVLAPEHPAVRQITTSEQQGAVGEYVKAAQAKSDIERQETEREKTGVFTGAYAINPINDERVPVWIADYVLYGYGTGAIMAVPAHDERDYAFAKKFDLPINEVVALNVVYDDKNAPREGVETIERRVVDAIIRNEKGEFLLIVEKDNTHFVGGGVDPADQDEFAAVKREVIEETGYTDIVSIKPATSTIVAHGYRFTKEKNQLGEGKFYEVVLGSEQRIDSEVETGNHELLWVKKDEVEKNITWVAHTAAWKQYCEGDSCYSGEGILINSGKYTGMSTAEAREKITTDLASKDAGEEVINYRMRDWLISRQRYWGAPIPIIHCPKDGAVAVPDDQLPVVLPEVESYEPSGDGRSPLANVESFVKTTCPTCGGPAERETDTMDGFACSSWYFLRFADPDNDLAAFSQDKADFWLPVDDYIGGAEHAVMHLLYARFWAKAMFDEGLIKFEEPFKTLRNQGMILAPDGVKMSKSKGNTIEPGGLIDQGYGADSIRIMELFIGPWNQMANWSVEGMGGAHRFLQRVWTLVQEFEATEEKSHRDWSEKDLNSASHKAIKKVTDDMHELGFNTAIAALMEYVNVLYKIKATDSFKANSAWKFSLETLLQLLSPFAPHIAEELWSQMGNKKSVHISKWPQYDSQYLVEEATTIAIQVNGKLRGEIVMPKDSGEEAVVEAAKTNEKVAGYLEGQEIRKTIYVPGKLVNFVV